MILDEIQKFYNPKETKYLTHSFHEYPNKFIPQIPRATIKEFTEENDVILDPFCGSGTTLIEANLMHRKSIGVDLSPLACLISRVKTTPLEIPRLKVVVKGLLENLHRGLKKVTLNDFIGTVTPNIPEFTNREYWFQNEALAGLGILKEFINRIEDEDIKDFCLVAFSSTVKKVSNASSLYKLTRKKKINKITRTDVYQKFEEKIHCMIKAMGEYSTKISSNFVKIDCGDAMALKGLECADCVITNPPLFSADFARCFKIFFWWLDFGDINEIDKRLIGTTNVKSNIKSLGIDLADDVTSKIGEGNSSMAAALSKYYFDMKTVFDRLYRVLNDNGHCCVYASDSRIGGNAIRCPDVFCELAKRAGFKVVNRIKRVIPRKAVVFYSGEKIEEFLISKK